MIDAAAAAALLPGEREFDSGGDVQALNRSTRLPPYPCSTPSSVQAANWTAHGDRVWLSR